MMMSKLYTAALMAPMLLGNSWALEEEQSKDLSTDNSGGRNLLSLTGNGSGGTVAIIVAAIIIVDVIATVFFLGFIQNATRKKLARAGIRTPDVLTTRDVKNFLRNRPQSNLERSLRRSLKKALFRHRSGEAEGVAEREDVGQDFPEEMYNLNQRVQDSIDVDLMDRVFGVVNIESEACRKRFVCQAQKTASSNSILSFIADSVNPYLSGLQNYEEAIAYGQSGADCDLIYSDCEHPEAAHNTVNLPKNWSS